MTDLKIFEYDAVDSTNLRAREHIEKCGQLPALFIADTQTAGRGRMGREFYSPRGSGLYMSLALRLEEATGGVTVTSAVAVALRRALSGYTDKTLSVKWVNDILADGKKASGILTEAVSDRESGKIKAIVIGIGVNLTTASFPEELRDTATCLGCDEIDRKRLAVEISEEIFSVLKEGCESVMKEYRRYSAVLGKEIYYIKNGERFDGEAVEILNDGALKVVRFDKTADILQSGEITLRMK